MNRPVSFCAGLLLCGLAMAFGLSGAEAAAPAGDESSGYQPSIAPASPEGERALQGFRLPDGLRGELFAAEPLVANPVAFDIDARGRIYVCETFRQQKGVEDNRNHMDWLLDDLAAQTVEDRLAYFKKHLGEKVQEYSREHDRIRLLEDTDGDGQADKATVFADGFNDIVAGTGAGVLVRDGHVWYTCIPNLWRLRDEDGDGRADTRKILSTGYGVRVAFRGHDMHGLVMGPDGRLYFSIGDRGYNVTTQEGERLVRPDTGAVFRCEPDGSHLEVFAHGLRNPQELAFDDHGNLFTVDNNSDSGDRARLEYIVEGGDYGWRMYYQYLDDRGPWNREMMWYPRDTPPLETPGPGGVPAGSDVRDRQPAYIIPPVANLSDGPSGLTYYPGVGLPERYKGHFFLADFRGGPANSGIRAFSVEPSGAGFALADSQEFIWSILATDVDFGWDGLYVSDWVNGWNGLGKGRIYRFSHPEHNEELAASGKLMREGFEQRTAEELAKLLGHPDQRIRLEAQFALVKKPRDQFERVIASILELKWGELPKWGRVVEFTDGIDSVSQASDRSTRLAQIHAVWALGYLLRHESGREARDFIYPLFQHPDPEIRAQLLKVIGDAANRLTEEQAASKAKLVGLFLKEERNPRIRVLPLDGHPRVRYFAALTLGKLGAKTGLEPLIQLLGEIEDSDPLLRHAAVMGLVGIGERHPQALLEAADHPHRSARLGVLLALRRLERPEIARFLDDVDPALVLEAARAINDVPIDAATPQLAALAGRPGMADALRRRVMNANFRLGKPEHARAVAAIAGDVDAPDALRLEALAELQQWGDPPPLDRVTNMWRPLDARSVEGLADVIRPVLGGIFSGSDAVRKAGAQLAAKYGIQEVGPVLMELAADADRAGSVRVEALRALASLKSDRLAVATDMALKAADPVVRTEGRRLLARQQPEKAVAVLDEALQTGETVEKQGAIHVLSEMQTPAADRVLSAWLDRLIARDVPTEIQLDLLEAAGRRNTPAFQQKLTAFERARPPGDPLAQYRETLAGGDAERGAAIFFGRSEVSCRRCHKIDGNGGEVGPDLSGIGAQKTREYLLASLVDPSQQIAKGYETAVLVLVSGKVVVGMVRSEDEHNLRLMLADGEIVTVPRDEIDERAEGKSAMPADLLKHLSKADVRDLVEFLTTLRKPVE